MEPSNIVNTEINKLFWENDHENKPKSGSKDKSIAPKLAIQYLESHPEAFTKNPKETQKLIGILEKTDLVKTEMEDSDWKTLNIMARQHPKLFAKFNEIAPVTTLSLNGTERSFSKNQLLMKSDVFRMILSSGSKEVGENRIEINGNYSKESVDLILNYLDQKDIEITGDTAFELLIFAHAYNINDLNEKNTTYLTNALSIENFTTILDGALKTNTQELTQACLIFAVENKDSINFAPTEETKLEFADAAKFLENLNDFKNNLKFARGHPFVEISSLENLDNLLVKLNNINEHLDLGLDLSKFQNLNDDQLENILEKSSNLKSLMIRSEKITKIEATKLNYLDCSGCKALTSISAPNATTLNCSFCRALTSISAPNATTLDCSYCPSLTSISAPNATKLDCHYCQALTSISAPNATYLNCRDCQALTSISAPNATTLYCINCQALTSISAPNATMLYCRGCPLLTSISAPNATKLHCSGCQALTSISAPNAAYLNCSGCQALTSISAPNATTLDCINCQALTSISAPNAIELYCHYCQALTSISAPNATELNCSYCQALTSISAPNAAYLNCSGCTNLTRAKITVSSSCEIFGLNE